eukprot:1842352-Rhodomonas_salina.1
MLGVRAPPTLLRPVRYSPTYWRSVLSVQAPDLPSMNSHHVQASGYHTPCASNCGTDDVG